MQQSNKTKGLQDLGNGIYAYLEPGPWGYSNAGLITDGGETMLVDTLYDLALTRGMLEAMREAIPAAKKIDVLVNTHSDGDHWFGNQAVAGAEIIATEHAAEEMKKEPPQYFAGLAKMAPTLGPVGSYFNLYWTPFRYDDLTPTFPTRTFKGRLDLRVGKKEVQLIEVGPAHSSGDAIVYVPEDRVIFTGDILFIGATPIVWSGSVAKWISTCDMMLGMDADKFVPGHGPVTNKKGVEVVKGYLEYVSEESRKRFNAGMTAAEAAMDIDVGRYASWSTPERIVPTVNSLYREFSEDESAYDRMAVFAKMVVYYFSKQQK